MWNPDYVKDMITMKSDQVSDKDAFIREADFNRDLVEVVNSRANLLAQLTALEEIRDEMAKCEEMADMNAYIAQKALVYTLIESYKSINASTSVATTLS